jgi:hypothetical protein
MGGHIDEGMQQISSNVYTNPPPHKSLPATQAAPASGTSTGAGISADALSSIAKTIATATAEALRPFLMDPRRTDTSTQPGADSLNNLQGASSSINPMNLASPPSANGNSAICDVISGAGGHGAGALEPRSRPGIPQNNNSAVLEKESGKNDLSEQNSNLEQTGVSINSLPHVDFVSDSVRKEIISGKYVNLASLLIPQYKESAPREVCIGDESFTIKPLNDKRLTRHLTIHEFSISFHQYKNIMCDTYPARRKELDDYHSLILKMSQQYGGFGFYDYHKQFAFKAAQYLIQKGINIDWSIRDSELFMSIFTGQRVNSCAVCFSVSHMTNFCPERANSSTTQPTPFRNPNTSKIGGRSSATPDFRGRLISTLPDGRQICNNFNMSVCKFQQDCVRAHVCLTCQGNHTQSRCPVKVSGPNKPNVQSNTSRGSGPNMGKPIPTTK